MELGGVGQVVLPRRLVYIVNRRTVVDQATDDAERLLRLFEDPSDTDDHAQTITGRRRARAVPAGDDTIVPLAVSTLRGELADNGQWKINPARRAIIIGTIDMIGSKLLFSGYGHASATAVTLLSVGGRRAADAARGFRRRSRHAGEGTRGVR